MEEEEGERKRETETVVVGSLNTCALGGVIRDSDTSARSGMCVLYVCVFVLLKSICVMLPGVRCFYEAQWSF